MEYHKRNIDMMRRHVLCHQSWHKIHQIILILSACIFAIETINSFQPAIIINNRQHHLFSVKSSSRLFSTPTESADDNNNNDNDELSKLIGKREQIKRSVKKRIDIAEENLQISTEPVVDLDLTKLPSFKVDRPRRLNEEDNNNEQINNEKDEKKKGKKIPEKAPIIDYMVDYDDENELHIPNRIGISTICWGDTTQNFVLGNNVKLTKRQIKSGTFVAGDVQLAYESLLASGITFIETSPNYGINSRTNKMSAEQLLGQCIQQHSNDELPQCIILTSSGMSSWKSLLSGSVSKNLINSLEQSLNRLSGKGAIDTMSSIDIFTVPKSVLFPTSLIAKGLSTQIESGQANYIGVEGITTPRKLAKLCNIMENKYDTKITTNTFDFSLTNTKNENMIQICKDNNVIPLISNPFDNGLASGIYTATNPSGGGSMMTTTGGSKAPKFTFKQLEKLQPLHSVQETIVERVRIRVKRSLNKTQERFKSKFGPAPVINTDITTTQIALQYIIAKGGVPIPAINTPKDANDIIGCLGWTLTDEEVDMLDSAIALCKL